MAITSRLLDRAAAVSAALTTPFLPDDYLGLVNPLWSARELRGRIEQVRREAGGATSLTIRPGRGWTSHTAGQYVGVGVEVAGVRHWRSYSLTGPPRADGLITITVKAAGLVSQHLSYRTPVTSYLQLRQADGAFTLPATISRRLLWITAGSGVTPVMGMLRSLDELGELPDAVHHHSALNRDEVIFGEELRAMAARHPRLRLIEQHTDRDGLLALTDLERVVPDWRERETWVCGPAGLLDAAEQHWADAGLSQLLHVERFAPKVLPGADVTSGSATFSRSGVTTPVTGTLLDAGEAAGVLMPSGCRMGICYSCVAPLLQGQVRDLRTGDIRGEPGDLIQTCVSAPAGDCAIDL